MKTNLDKAEVGDTVHFKCGGKAVISRKEVSEMFDSDYFLCFERSELGIHFKKSGRVCSVV